METDDILKKLSSDEYINQSELDNIAELDLSGKNVTQLPKNMNLLTKLTSLNLSNNPSLFTEDVNSIPESNNVNRIGDPPPENNEVIEKPSKFKLTIETLFTLPSLTSLNLSQNKLTSLPDNISGLKNLKVLNLSQNELTSLPGTIPSMSQLQILNLSQNKLTSLPSQVKVLKNLVILNLKDSGISLDIFLANFTNRSILRPLFVSVDTIPIDANKDSNIVYTDILDNEIQFENVTELIAAYNKLPVSYIFEKNTSLVNFSGKNIKKPIDILASFKRDFCTNIQSCQITASLKNDDNTTNTTYKTVPKTGTKGGSTSKKTKKSRKSTKKTKRRKYKKH